MNRKSEYFIGDFIEFDRHDIVRSDLVKEYIISKLDLGMS